MKKHLVISWHFKQWTENGLTFHVLFLIFLLTLSNLLLCLAVEAKSFRVARFKVIKEYGKSVDWSHSKDLIASAKRGSDGYYDIFVMKPDGSNEECLTCGKPGVPQKHNGNPAWHPSGGYLVFTSEKNEDPEKYKKWAIPGTGFNCDLWAMTSDGTQFYQLTDYPLRRPFRAVIHPQFSHDGKRIFWAERVRDGSSFGGGWFLKIADFVIDRKKVRIVNERTLSPGAGSCFYESHAFSGDDRKILFSGNLLKGQSHLGLDIYELDLESGHLKRLTETSGDWDEHAHYSPDGRRIAWMSSRGMDIKWGDVSGHKWQKYLKTDLWIMNADGSEAQRLTHFNERGHPEYMGGRRCIVSDSAWGPEGRRIVALLAYENRRGRLRTRLVMMALEEE